MRDTIDRLVRSPWFPIVLTLGTLALIYQIGYMTYGAVPGNNAKYPLGWWGWADQGLYLKSSIALSHGDLSPGKHVYMPLYPFLGSLLLGITSQHSYWLPDLLLMLGFASLFFALVSRYVGTWWAASALVLGMAAFHPLRLQWFIPWTSTLSAFLIMAALYLLDRQVRLEKVPGWSKRSAALNAALFGLAVGAQAATRPVDLVVMAPIALFYAFFLLRSVFDRENKRRGALLSILSGTAGFLVPFLGWLAFNHAVYGNFLGGPYLDAAQAYGFFPSTLEKKLFSQLLDSHALYGEAGQDWLSRLPLFTLALAFLPAAFIAPVAVVFRAAAIACLVQFGVYYSYSDIVPPGTFRFLNIHYFKWMMPLLLVVALQILQGVFAKAEQRQRASRLAMIPFTLLALVALGTTTVERTLPVTIIAQNDSHIVFGMPDAELDFIDVPGVTDNWTAIYFARGFSITLDDQPLHNPRDFHPYPIPGGMRILFVRPVSGKRLTLDLGKDVRLTYKLSEPLRGVEVELRPGWLFSRRGERNHALVQLGRTLTFSTGGAAAVYLGKGWAGAESWGRWIDGERADMQMRLPSQPKGDIILMLKAGGFVAGPMHPETVAEIVANDCPIGELRFDNRDQHEYFLRIPLPCIGQDGKLRLVFHNLTPISPKSLGGSQDTRRLGMGVLSMRLEPAEATAR